MLYYLPETATTSCSHLLSNHSDTVFQSVCHPHPQTDGCRGIGGLCTDTHPPRAHDWRYFDARESIAGRRVAAVAIVHGDSHPSSQSVYPCRALHLDENITFSSSRSHMASWDTVPPLLPSTRSSGRKIDFIYLYSRPLIHRFEPGLGFTAIVPHRC
jgi:hypothetical protein